MNKKLKFISPLSLIAIVDHIRVRALLLILKEIRVYELLMYRVKSNNEAYRNFSMSKRRKTWILLYCTDIHIGKIIEAEDVRRQSRKNTIKDRV